MTLFSCTRAAACLGVTRPGCRRGVPRVVLPGWYWEGVPTVGRPKDGLKIGPKDGLKTGLRLVSRLASD